MSTFRLMDGVSGRPGVGSSGTQPPGAPTAFSGNYIAGLVFQITGTIWLQGYWWYVPPGGDTGPVKCALWQQGYPGVITNATFSPGSTVTSGILTAGQFNFIPLPAPILLSNDGTSYVAAVGYATTIGFPDTTHQFGAGNPYASGITNGPLSAPATTASNVTGPQQPFTIAGSDPAVFLPSTNNLDDLLWVDVQVTDTPPVNASYRLWPNHPYSPGDGANFGISIVTDGYNIGPQFTLTVPCALNKIWFYSGTGVFGASPALALPTRTGLWDVNTHLEVAGSDITGVAWKKPDGTAGAVGQGWLYADYSAAGVILRAGNSYKANAWYAGGQVWRTVVDSYWTTGGAGAGGLTQGPMSAPNDAGATPGQESWNGPNLAWAYPGSHSAAENDWIDVEVTPALITAATSAGDYERSSLRRELIW